MSVYVYLLTAFVTIYLVRMLPLVLLRKDIKSRFIKSFLFYVPYVTLSVMTFPAIIFITENLLVGIIGLIAAVLVAYFTENLFKVAVAATAAACITQLIIGLL